MKSWNFPLYPLLMAGYCPIYMMAADQGMTDVVNVIRPTIACVLLALLLMVILSAMLRDRDRAAFWVAMIVGLIFGGKFAQRIIARVIEGATEPVAELFILAGMTAVAVLLAIFVRPGHNMTRIANVIAAVMVIFPTTALLQREFSFSGAAADTRLSLPESSGFHGAMDTGIRPNIVHVVLDGYSRQDVLADLYEFDNTPFLNRLRDMGFAVADRATTPFNQTLLVMSSIFSGTMLEGSQRAQSGIELRDTVRSYLRHNPVMETLSRLGYRTAAVDVRYDPVRMDFLDQLLEANAITNFEAAVFQRTSLYFIAYNLGLASPSISHEVFTKPYESELTDPFFLYVHLLAPHPPFDVNRHGQAIRPEGGHRGMVDGNHLTDNSDHRRELYQRGYVEKLEFVNQGVLSMVRRIISRAIEPTVIIIHGDHGGGLHLNHANLADTCVQERFSPLVAVYASDDRLQRALPTDLNLVNLYRVVFNTYFGTEMPLLPNRSVFANWMNPARQQTVPSERLTAAPGLCTQVEASPLQK
ncbi:LTA synthase family protein (plasmid) [Skermanella rosea]|uniref:sulfatase-like hydrolase/transferase n=1 Tax=Skermanella rosea TaxID=1817965 RepID=UPI001932EFB7|nr:sulfatase-like hydrolase/transferase [Skermanella rosea]UEM07564.1 LTA synthase family protein [Skermanella rosea]